MWYMYWTFCSNIDSFSDIFGCSRILTISYYEIDYCFIGKGNKIYFDKEINCCENCTEIQIDVKYEIEYKYCNKCYKNEKRLKNLN